jgi:transcriptional regulator with XRE-family HTH domain/tetratricopeptide (TPR) repeat protein
MAAARRRVELTAARKAAGLTQEQLARGLNIETSTVARWEQGRHLPQPYLWPKLARALGITRAQLQHLLGNEDGQQLDQAAPVSIPQQQSLDDMHRRTFVKWGVTTTAAAGLGVSAGNSAGMGDVRRLQLTVSRLHNLDQQHGGDALWQSAAVQANEGIHLLEGGGYSDAVGTALLTVIGQLHICAGWLSFDAGQHELARTYFTEALAMSGQVNDPYIETRALANLALQSNALKRPREAQRYAGGAQHAATTRSPRSWLTAVPHLRIAMASSLLRSPRDADRALADARRALEYDGNTATEEWSSFLSPLEVDAVEATCALESQQPRRAAQLLEQAIAGYSARCARNVALYRVRLARAYFDMGAVDGAALAGTEALRDLSGEVASWRVADELATVADRLKKYQRVEGVEHFLGRYQEAGL